jgi:hypothetical protein
MCYNLQLTLLGAFSKVKVKKNLSCGLLILTIDLILMERADLSPPSLWKLGFHSINKVYEKIDLTKGRTREREIDSREIDCIFAGESFCRRTEESLAGGSTHFFTKSQRLSFRSGRAIQSDVGGPYIHIEAHFLAVVSFWFCFGGV